jgi:hypothetical protein
MTITLDPKLDSRLRERAGAEGLTVAAYIELESLALEGPLRRADRGRSGLLGREAPPAGRASEQIQHEVSERTYLIRPAGLNAAFALKPWAARMSSRSLS